MLECRAPNLHYLPERLHYRPGCPVHPRRRIATIINRSSGFRLRWKTSSSPKKASTGWCKRQKSAGVQNPDYGAEPGAPHDICASAEGCALAAPAHTKRTSGRSCQQFMIRESENCAGKRRQAPIMTIVIVEACEISREKRGLRPSTAVISELALTRRTSFSLQDRQVVILARKEHAPRMP